MQYLVQMKLIVQGRPTSPKAEIALAENYIFPPRITCLKTPP
jgi:hypothetical protein